MNVDDSTPEAVLRGALDSLAAALAREAALLASGPPEQLLDAVAKKRRALRHLENLARDQCTLAALQSGATRDALIGQLRACRLQNLASGSAIVRARQGNDRVLRFLGQLPTTSGYAKDGHIDTGPATRPLGSA